MVINLIEKDEQDMRKIMKGTKITRERLLTALGMTMLAFLISLVMISPLSFSAMSLFSAPEKSDYTISDFYEQVANHRSVRTLDPRIVIVDIGNYGRAEIAEAIETVAFSEPLAAAIDVTFTEPRDSATDARLIETIGMLDRPVMAVTVKDAEEEGVFSRSTESYFMSETEGAIPGVVNFPVNVERGTVREFRPYFRMAEGGATLSGFSAAVAGRVSPEREAELKGRGNEYELIDYPSREFTVIPIEELSGRAEELKDKIVLIGAADELSDVHSTPTDSRMPGIEMHAYALSQILESRYYTSTGTLFDWVSAFLLCFGLILLSITMPVKVKGLVIRVLQLLTVYLAIQLGYTLFVDSRIVVNFSYILLMLMFGLFAVDIWNGLAYLAERIMEKRRRRRAGREETEILDMG